MSRFKIFSFILALLITNILVCACKFPDNVLDWQNIKEYKTELIKLGETTTSDFINLVKSKPDQKIGDVSIFNTHPSDNSTYKKIRVGFKKDKLDWIEFTLNKDVEMSKFTDIYGKPQHINKAYSDVLDYYDYSFFNISTDKQHTYAQNITIFEKPKFMQNQEKVVDLGNLIPEWKNLNTVNFLGLKPGYSIEANFNSSYPEILINNSGKGGTSSVYILDKELGKAKSQYKKVELVYNNGLLSWISLIPKGVSLNQIIKVWGSKYTLEPINTIYDLYDFSSVMAVVDKRNKMVVKLGIVSAK